MKNRRWLSYNELAWLERIVAPPDEYAKETEKLCKLIREHSNIKPKTLLHLGSGAGINDYTFKKHFEVTGVDISRGMIEEAKKLNPDVTYFNEDMRTVELERIFDTVVIPEAINYMTTVEDIRKVINTVDKQLKPGGVFLFITHLREEFMENNFVYTGSEGSVEVTVFENNYLPDPEGTTYEATMVYLVRSDGELEIYTDLHLLGLFGLDLWLKYLKRAGFEVEVRKEEDNYTPYILGEGKYPLRIFICNKPL